MHDQDAGQWVARSRRGKVIATAPTALRIMRTLRGMGWRADGATAKFESAASGGT